MQGQFTELFFQNLGLRPSPVANAEIWVRDMDHLGKARRWNAMTFGYLAHGVGGGNYLSDGRVRGCCIQ